MIKTNQHSFAFVLMKRFPLYPKFRTAGHDAKQSLRSAKIVATFSALESEGLVRLRAEPEQESYLDSYGEPEGYTDINGKRVSAEQALKDLCETIDRDGCWWTCSEVLVDGEWEQADSCGMHTGYSNPLDPIENCYVTEHMKSAIDRVSAMETEYVI